MAGTTGFSTPLPIRCSTDTFTVASAAPPDHGQLPLWRARVVPVQSPGTPRTPQAEQRQRTASAASHVRRPTPS